MAENPETIERGRKDQEKFYSRLQQVRLAVINAGFSYPIQSKQRKLLGEIEDALLVIESRQIREDLKGAVEEIKRQAEKLTAVTTEIKQNIAELKGIAKNIEKVTKVLGILASGAEAYFTGNPAAAIRTFTLAIQLWDDLNADEATDGDSDG
jgi:hypothetical protein